MRIAIFHNLPSGGAKRAVYEWTSRLAERNKIDVYTLNTADHTFCDIQPFSETYEVLDFAPRKLLDSPFGRLNQFLRWRDLLDLERLNRKIAEKINAGGYDVLFAHPDIVTLIPSLLSYVTIPSVYYLHEPFGPSFVRSIHGNSSAGGNWRGKLDRIDPLIGLYQNRLGNMRERSVRKTKQLLSNSEFTRKHIQMGYGVEAPVCHLGVNLTSFRRMLEITREDFVVSVGELSPRKGFAFVIESLGHIPSEIRPPLKIACNSVDQDEKARVQELALRHGVDLEILFGLNTNDLCLLYNRARLCVYTPVMEPFGLVPLEAMACEIAVVGVREGGVMESVVHEHTGLLIERDAEQFGSAVARLIRNPGLTAEYGKNGRKHVLENWTWERSTAELEQHLRNVCSLPDGV